jgi:hypothetical protein
VPGIAGRYKRFDERPDVPGIRSELAPDAIEMLARKLHFGVHFRCGKAGSLFDNLDAHSRVIFHLVEERHMTGLH